MIQRKYRENKKTKIFFGITTLFCLILAASPASAQELTPVIANSVGANETLGTPVSELISAASSGGLSGAQDLFGLSNDIQEQAPMLESLVAPDSLSESPSEAPPAFSSDSLKDLESQGGLSSAPQVEAAETPTAFNLAVKFFEKVVFKKDVEFASRPIFEKGLDIAGQPTFNKDTAGYAIIEKGNQNVEVDFDHEYDSPPVVTATLSLQQYKDPDVRAVAEDLLLISDVRYIITNVSKKSFQIMMDRKADSDIPFSWHALAVNDAATAKKQGEKVKSKIGNDLNPDSNARTAPALVGQSQVSSNTIDANSNANGN
jgi:hypothetical protein